MSGNEMIASLVHEGRTYYNSTPEDLRAAGVPDAVIGAAVGEERVAAIKAECKERIYAKASAETQSNLHAVANVINSKTASSRTDEEKATLAAYAEAVEWIAAMRATVQTLAADPASDFAADASWPVPSAAAVALAEQF